MRRILFTGKGGVGKTTVAAATASHWAAQGVKTLVLSTDAAHSLGDTLGVHLHGDEVREVAPALWAQQVDGASRLRRGWDDVQRYLLDVLAAAGVEPMDAEDLTMLPGADDVQTLLALRDHVQDGPWDLVVVDCAPTAETLRLLALPDALSRVLERLMPAQRVLAKALVPAVARSAGLPVPGRQVAPALLRLREELAEAVAVVRDPHTTVRLVLTPEAVVLAEARRTYMSLTLHGFTVDGVVANRVVPDEPGSAWQRHWVQAQSEVLAQVRTTFQPVPVTTSAYLSSEPVGVQALARLGGEVCGTASVQQALAVPASVRTVQVEQVGDGFELVLDAPLVRASDLDLARHGDDLLVSAGGPRRVVALPSVLRRCTVSGARLSGGRLHVTFRRDPDLWPQP